MYIPSSTYRVQLHKGFNFSRLSDILPYLHELGITTIYASPVTRSLKGSEHGYDVINPLEINPEIGTAEQWESITDFLEEKGMGWLQDIVPNHMAYSTENPWICDVLERGEGSDFYSFFDIIPQTARTQTGAGFPPSGGSVPSTRIMLPFLAQDAEGMIRSGEIKLQFGQNGFFFQSGSQIYPVTIDTYQWICSIVSDLYQPLLAWSAKIVSFASLPWPEWIHFKKRMIRELWNNPRLQYLAASYADRISQDPELLKTLLNFQSYQLCSWETSFSKMNYRRFFAVNSLICLRMEDAQVFNTWHPLLLSLFHEGMIQGFRIDHIDGLFDPAGYLQKLREATGPGAYILSEKILQEDEETIPDWPVQGTTGYDFLSFVNQLLIHATGKQKLDDYFKKNIRATPYPDMVLEKKQAFLQSHLNGELNNLMRWLDAINPGPSPRPEREALKEALGLLMAAFPVYRIYADRLPLSETDQYYIHQAFRIAAARAPSLKPALDWLHQLFHIPETDANAGRVLYFLRRWAQYTAPLAAKGTEDTVFYTYNPLIGLNEVGDSPAHSAVTAPVFHALMEGRRQRANLSMNASSTHDTKRGEDNRLRINLISLFADEWLALVEKWKRSHQPFIRMAGSHRSPSANDEYLIYQALVGSVPEDGRISLAFRKRFGLYLNKALREEKQETHWETPNELYERNCHDFVQQILSPTNAFLNSFLPFTQKIIARASVFALSQTLLKLTAPGIPDIYQGAELWDLSLVDPDNRLPVDFDRRKKMLKELLEVEEKQNPSLLFDYLDRHRAEGAQKMFLIRKLLHYRKRYPDLFNQGLYIPLVGTRNLIGYLRTHHDHQLFILAPLPAPPEETLVPAISGIHGRWEDLLTGEPIELNETTDLLSLMKRFPVAALTRSATFDQPQ